MTSIRVVAAVRDALGSTATAEAMADILDREGLRSTVDKPSITRAGVLPGIARRTLLPAEIVPGAQIRDADIDFYVKPPAWPTGWSREAATITFRNVKNIGPTAVPASATGLVQCNPMLRCPTRWIDSELDPQTPNMQRVGWHAAHDVDIIRCRGRRLSDMVQAFNYNPGHYDDDLRFLLKQSLFHEFGQYTAAVHADGVQIQGGRGITIEGNALAGWVADEFPVNQFGTRHINTPVMIAPDVGNIGPCAVVGNWIEGGSAGITVRRYDRDSSGAIVRQITDQGKIQRNRFKRGSFRLGATTAMLLPMAKDAAGVWRLALTVDLGTMSAGTANVWDGEGVEAVPSNGGAP